MTLLDCTLHLA